MSRVKNRLLAKLFGSLPALAERWGRRLPRTADPIPWTKPRKALRDASLAVITTGGVHLKIQRPFDMADPDGDPTCREIPIGALRGAMTITHDYYDHADAEKDLNLVLPVQRLRELAERGALGSLHPVAYSFMGHIDGPHLETFRTKRAPEVARALADARVDYVLLVPA